MFPAKYNLFATEDKTGGPIEDNELGKEGIIKFLEEDDEKEEKLDLKESDKEEKEEIDEEKDEKVKDELDELEEELEVPDEDKLELVTPVRKREILEKYPKIFKDFPYLEKAYYREQQFTEIVPTIEDAKEAVAKADVLDKFESDLSQGNITQAMRAVKEVGEDAFNTLVDNYLPNLYNIDKDAYHHVVGNIVKMTVNGMLNEAKSSNNSELQEAAKILNQFVFATNEVKGPTNLSREKKDNTEKNEIEKERIQLRQQSFENTRDSLNTKVENILKATIEANIDPKESMTDYVRKTASRDTQEELEALLSNDKRLTVMLDKLWEQSFKENFSKRSIDNIKSAYLSRAKTLLPGVIKKARNEALKGLGKRVAEEDTGQKKGSLPVGKTTSSRHSSVGKSDKDRAKEIPAGMSSRDYLMSD